MCCLRNTRTCVIQYNCTHDNITTATLELIYIGMRGNVEIQKFNGTDNKKVSIRK
jgi:hypothetical protein